MASGRRSQGEVEDETMHSPSSSAAASLTKTKATKHSTSPRSAAAVDTDDGHHHTKSSSKPSSSSSSSASDSSDGHKMESKEATAIASVGGGDGDEVKVMEKGLIYWMYRPKVEKESVDNIDDVQRLYFLLAPSTSLTNAHEGNEHTMKRLIMVPKKMMPKVSTGSHRLHKIHRSSSSGGGGGHGNVGWCFVEKVSKSAQEIVETKLDGYEYHTKTRGDREVKGVRPVGEGVYEILQHGDHASLAYVLEIPTEIGEAQKAFNIMKEGSYIIQVKNPARDPGSGPKAKFPQNLQQLFQGKRVAEVKFRPAIPPDFLNHENTQLLLIPESRDVVDEFGDVGKDLEEEMEKDMKLANKELSSIADKPYEELHMTHASHKRAASDDVDDRSKKSQKQEDDHPNESLVSGHFA